MPVIYVGSWDLNSGLLACGGKFFIYRDNSPAKSPEKFKEHFDPALSMWWLWVASVLLKEKHESEPVENLGLDIQGGDKESW